MFGIDDAFDYTISVKGETYTDLKDQKYSNPFKFNSLL